MLQLGTYLTNDSMLIEEDRVLLVGEWKCSSLEGMESTVQGSMTETWKPGSG